MGFLSWELATQWGEGQQDLLGIRDRVMLILEYEKRALSIRAIKP